MKKFSRKEIDKFIEMLDFSKIEGKVVPVIAQDYKTNEVLMLAFANEDAIRQSLETGIACYYSRSRKKLWKKGRPQMRDSDLIMEICKEKKWKIRNYEYDKK